jgi:hypothetical protein
VFSSDYLYSVVHIIWFKKERAFILPFFLVDCPKYLSLSPATFGVGKICIGNAIVFCYAAHVVNTSRV